MQVDKILEILSYTLPSVVTGGVAYYFFVKHINHEENRRRFYLLKKKKKQSFPLRLQAYERMVLFLERMNPNKLLFREKPKSDDKSVYLQQLVTSIEHEFEHNLSQQIYMTDQCWDIILTAKNATLQLIRNKTASSAVISSNDLIEVILKEGIQEAFPSTTAISYIKSEIKDFL